MAGRGRKGGDPQLIAALAAGASGPAAAEQAGVSAKTVQGRLADADFRAKVDAARNELLERTVGRLSAVGVLAGDKLYSLMQEGSPAVQLGAARAALEFLLRGHEVAGLARQVGELRRQVEDLTRGRARAEGGADEAAGAGSEPAGGGPDAAAEQAAG